MTIVLSSGGLNPSNAQAERTNGGHKVFPNLARRIETRIVEIKEYPWSLETMQIINKLTPDIKGKAFDPDWFLLRNRLEAFEATAIRKKHGYPTIADEIISKDEAARIFAEVDEQILRELAEAGMPKFKGDGNIGAYDMTSGGGESARQAGNGCYKEVPTGIIGYFLKWKFERAWYYYVASGAGIPPEFAVPFDKEWGKEVRVDGDCTCRGAKFWGEGFGIGMYHIDTQQGLNAFVEMLRKIYRSRSEE